MNTIRFWPRRNSRSLHVGPDDTAGCPDCSTIADGFNGLVIRLANHDVMLRAVPRAPPAKS
jgi:predicted dithiol-disulfide oxidoreductase (DUF899 family)